MERRRMCGLFSELLGKLSLTQNKCLAHLLSSDTKSAISEALKVYETTPRYLILACFHDLERNRRLFWKVLDKETEIDPLFLLLLLRSNSISTEEASKVVYLAKNAASLLVNSQDGKESFLTLSLKKECLLREGGSSAQIDEMLDHIDDARLYEYARKNDLKLRERSNSTNYLRHEAMLGDADAAGKLLLKETSFDDIYSLCNASNVNVSPEIKVLIGHIEGTLNEEEVRKMISLYSENPSLLNAKILIAVLVGSKRPENILLAMQISWERAFENNYEVTLIYLFACRYFCLVPEILHLYKSLDVKNIQQYNMTYLWSDPLIFLGILYDHKAIRQALAVLDTCYNNDLSVLKKYLFKYVSRNRIAHAVSIIENYRQIKSSVVIKELEERKILATKESTIFSSFLGKPCEYFFNKATPNTFAYYMIKSSDDLEKIVKNNYIPLRPDFISHFKKCLVDAGLLDFKNND